MSDKVAKWRREMQEISLDESPQVRQVNDVWHLIDRAQAWKEAGPRMFDEHLERFQKVAISVLGERDPKFELPAEDRIAAAIHGKSRRYSVSLRKGVAETLALLGSWPEALSSCSQGKPSLVASLIIRELLSPADPVLWASLNDVFPLLAEAAPGEFLTCLEDGFASPTKPFEFLFDQEHDGVFGATYISGLLWGLEALSWSPDYLARAALVLGRFAEIDPGGNWGNRPSGSLYSIFCPWFPQTCAPVERRVAAVKALVGEYPDVGWALVLALLPSAHQSSSGSHKPKWRSFIPDDHRKKPTNEEYWQQVSEYAKLALMLATRNFTKLPDLVARIPNLPADVRADFFELLASPELKNLNEEERYPIWDGLQRLILHHQKFADAEWAMSPSIVADLQNRADGIKPEAPASEHQRLFTEDDFHLITEEGDYNEQRSALDARRQAALKLILNSGGLDKVIEMAVHVESPWRLGYTLGVLPEVNADERLLPVSLPADSDGIGAFLSGYIWGRYSAGGWGWVDLLDMSTWPDKSAAWFFARLPFCKNTWDRVAARLGESEGEYWELTGGNTYEAGDDAELGVGLLAKNGRALTAVRGLQSIRYQKKVVDLELAVEVLEAALASGEDPNRLDAHAVVQIISTLQKAEGVDRRRLGKLEWGFLPLLNRFSGGHPAILEQALAEEPDFFCEVIQWIYRPKGKKAPVKEPSEDVKRKAESAYRLLHDWHTPPGTLADGGFSGEGLTAWVDSVKKNATESGHLEVALHQIGQVLFYTQRFAEELWLPEAVARILNENGHEEMRRGLTMECFNSRGVHGFTHGKAERELADGYRSKADAFDLAGFPRLAVSLRDLAESYERDAEREAKRNPYRD